MARGRPPDAPGEALIGWRAGWIVALVLLVGSAALVGHHLRWGRRTDDPLRALLAALAQGDDDDAYAQMSARYRQGHPLAAFRSALASMSELRSAEGVSLDHPTLGEWRAAETPAHLCGILREVTPAGLVAATVVEEGGRFALDALSLNERQLDPSRPTDRRRCPPTIGPWR